MTQEDKELLLKDLCARLPHKVRIKCDGYPNGLAVTGIVGEQVFHTPYFIGGEIIINKHTIDAVRPYLRPMSSMTSDEWMEYCDACVEDEKSWTWARKEFKFTPITHKEDFMNAHHFDYRGLIPMGLALEATEGMYKTE